MKNIIITIVVLIVVAAGAYFYLHSSFNVPPPANVPPIATSTTGTSSATTTPPGSENGGTGTSTAAMNKAETVIGKSVQGRDITAYHFGTGSKELLFVGDIHGGYEWNTALLMFDLMDYLKQNPSAVPSNETVTVIPTLNPDGLYKTVGTDGRFATSAVPTGTDATVPGRFNANNVDLNRNFDCDWQATGVWQNKSVSGGTSAFSEPESQAIRDYVQSRKITAAVVYYSAAGGVFSSNCHDGVLPETTTLTDLYANASGYKAYESFDFYKVTGDMVNWLAKEKIPAISVLLLKHTDVEWGINKAGIEAILKHYAQ